jgi:hypothetical protein
MEFNLFNDLLVFTVDAIAERTPVFVISPRGESEERSGGSRQ